MSAAETAAPIVTMSEAQAYVRIETGEEEAIVAALIRTASALCEAFLNQVIIARPFSVLLPASTAWQRIELAPVRAISEVAAVALDGATRALDSGDYAVDIDSRGEGWVRLSRAVDTSRARVSGTAGLAGSQNDVPEPIRHGVLRLVAHMFNVRDGDGGDPPAAVTALWRPYRRMRLA